MNDAPWSLRSSPRPPGDGHAALVTEPRGGAALLLCEASRGDDAGRGELWRWCGEGWSLVRGGLFPETAGRCFGASLAWVEAAGVVLARSCDAGLVRATMAEPDAVSVVSVPGMTPHMSHVFAFGDGADGAWLLAGDSSAGCTITWRIAGDVGVEVARAPYLVRAAFDPRARLLVGNDVQGRGYRLVGAAWQAEPRFGGKLDALVDDPRLGAIVGLRVDSDERMEMVVLGAMGWEPARVPLWLPTFRNQMRLCVDLRTRQLLAFGGQDFAKGGAPSAATWYGEAGEMRETGDPALPPWGRYNTLLTADDGLLAFDHSALALHRRDGEGWRRVGAIEGEVRADLDDRFTNVTRGPDGLLLLQSTGALIRWRPGAGVHELAGSSRARKPGPAYSQRTGIGWDPIGGRLVVGSGDCGRSTHYAADGAWHELTGARGFVAGEIAVMASTSAGLYALGAGGLRLLTGDTWTTVADGPAGASARWLGFEPRRGGLLAVNHAGLWLLCEGGWRWLAMLPGAVSIGEARGQLGVDPRRDELVLIDDPRMWSMSLAALDWAGATLPVRARAGAPARGKRQSR